MIQVKKNEIVSHKLKYTGGKLLMKLEKMGEFFDNRLSEATYIFKRERLFYLDGLYGGNEGRRKGEFPESFSVKKRREHYRSRGLSL